MGRPKGSKNAKKGGAEKKSRAPKDSAGSVPGHNGAAGALSDDERAALHFKHTKEYERDLALKKKADADLRNTAKRIKAEGGSVSSVKITIALRTPEGEAAFKARVSEECEIAKWNGVGVQLGMFEEVDRAPLDDREFARGKRDGLAGNRQEANASQHYLRGFFEGNSVLANTLAPKTQPAEAADGDDAIDAETEAFMPEKPDHVAAGERQEAELAKH